MKTTQDIYPIHTRKTFIAMQQVGLQITEAPFAFMGKWGVLKSNADCRGLGLKKLLKDKNSLNLRKYENT